MFRYKRFVVAVVSATLLSTGLPAAALVTEPGPCLGYEFDLTPFTDVADTSPHRADIECISGWDITVNVGTYDPKAPVTRWQMALFLTRTLDLVQVLPSGAPQGFTDIGGLPADQRLAIDQLGELSITTGTSATTYDPNAPVTRWQMALFLRRLVQAAMVPLPAAADQGFIDVGGLSLEARQAVNQLKLLGITAGTSATTFSPDQVVTREQMASFLARTLGVVWYLDPVFESDTHNCVEGAENCAGSGVYWDALPFSLRAGWFAELPYASAEDQAAFLSPTTRVEILVDGVPVVASARQVALKGIVYKSWSVDYPSGLSGEHTIRYVFYYDGEVVQTQTFTFDFSF